MQSRYWKTTVKDMKLEAINTDAALTTHDFRKRRGEEKYPQRIHVHVPLMSLRVGTAAGREYMRELRAAEMAAWKLSGGDYLLSRCATQ
jgi:hypothetical protein